MGFKVDYIKDEHSAILEFIGIKNSIILLEEPRVKLKMKWLVSYDYLIYIKSNNSKDIFFVGKFKKMETALRYFNKSKKELETITIT
jgi:hypothetical protein